MDLSGKVFTGQAVWTFIFANSVADFILEETIGCNI